MTIKPSKTNKQRPSCHFTPKRLNLSLTGLMGMIGMPLLMLTGLSACQSMSSTVNNTSTTNTALSANPNKAVFNQPVQLFNTKDAPSAAQQSKDFLLTVLQQHMKREHTSVSQTRFHISPYINNPNDIESNDDSLFETILKVADYRDKKYSDEAEYESDSNENEQKKQEQIDEWVQAYLDDDSTSWYQRFDEQQSGSVAYSDTAINKTEGMSEDYLEKFEAVSDYLIEKNDCLNDYSAQLDGILDADEDLVIDNPKVQDSKQEYDTCNSEVDDNYQQIKQQATGYLKNYIAIQNQCRSRYDKHINIILAPENREKSIDYDVYDNIYESYYVCHHQNISTMYLEPANYIRNNFTDDLLKNRLAKIQCEQDLTEAQKTLDSKGNNYFSNGQAYLQNYDDYENCMAETSNDDDYVDNDYDDTTEKQSFFADYKEMKQQELSQDKKQPININKQTNSILNQPVTRILGSIIDDNSDELSLLLKVLQKTPEQIAAMDYYSNALTLNTVSHYQPSQQRYLTIHSLNVDSATNQMAIDIPVEFDFQQRKFSIDPAAILPLLAIAEPEHTPMPKDINGKVVAFTLPKELDKVPVTMLQQSLIQAMSQAMQGLNPEYFTDLNLQNDNFAKQVGASRGIKLTLGSKQSGELFSRVLKAFALNIQDYMQTHSDEFSDENSQSIKKLLDSWVLYNHGYQSKDMAGLFQLVEGVLPIDFNQFNYYYFDKQNRLIARQSDQQINSGFTKANMQMVSQIRYDQLAFKQSANSKKLTQIFGNKRQEVNGNQLLNEYNTKHKINYMAQSARKNYDLPEFDDDLDSDEIEYQDDLQIDENPLNEQDNDGNNDSESELSHVE